MDKQQLISNYKNELVEIEREIQEQEKLYATYKKIPLIISIIFVVICAITSFVFFGIGQDYEEFIGLGCGILFGGIALSFLINYLLKVSSSANIIKIENIRKIAAINELNLKLNNLQEDLDVVVPEDNQ